MLIIILIAICFVLLLIAFTIISNLIKRNKYIGNLHHINNGISIIKKSYHESIIKFNGQKSLLYFYYGKKDAFLQINNRETYIYSYGGKNPYEKKKSVILNNLKPFLSNAKYENKILVMFPKCRKIVRYINESELEIVTPLKKVYDIYITNCDDFTLFKDASNI